MRAKLGKWVVMDDGQTHNGESLDSYLVDPRTGDVLAHVTHVRGITYTAWTPKRDGGYRGPLEAQRGAERAIRKRMKAAPPSCVTCEKEILLDACGFIVTAGANSARYCEYGGRH